MVVFVYYSFAVNLYISRLNLSLAPPSTHFRLPAALGSAVITSHYTFLERSSSLLLPVQFTCLYKLQYHIPAPALPKTKYLLTETALIKSSAHLTGNTQIFHIYLLLLFLISISLVRRPYYENTVISLFSISFLSNLPT